MKGIRIATVGVALSSFIGNAWAEEICARAQDLTALQVAAVQQELMVAAFSCNDAGLYNTFVITYQKDLQTSDVALQAYFQRLNPKTGTADYHAYKTRRANISSIRSSGNAGAYCRRALSTFRAALNEGKTSLASFVLSQPMAVDANYRACGDSIPGGAMATQASLPAAPPVAGPPRVLPANPALNAPAEPAVTPQTNRGDPVYSAQNGQDPYARDRESYAQSRAPAYRNDSRDPYARDPYPPAPYPRDRYGRVYGDAYGYSNNYGERDPYYRNPYARSWYGAAPPQFYMRRR